MESNAKEKFNQNIKDMNIFKATFKVNLFPMVKCVEERGKIFRRKTREANNK